MKQQQPLQEDEEFDILIVGAGPSAAGLLYGILTRIIQRSNDDSSSTKQQEKNVVMTHHHNLRIAILERGCNNNEASCDCSSTISSNFEHSHPVTVSLQNWFHAAHYDSENDIMLCRVPPPRKKQIDRQHYFCHPTILHTTTPQSNLSNRIIDVPTGNGYGGGTNINAGLVVRPKHCWHDYSDTDNSGSSSSSSAGSSGGGDFDAWPGMWKSHGRGGRKRSLIVQSMDEIWNVMKANDALITTSTSSSSSSSLSSSGDDVEDYDNTDGEEDSSFIGTTTTKASSFQQPTFAAAASSSSSTNNHHRRVNYFTSLITPLLQQHPELYSNVTFLSGVEVERVLIRYACNDNDVRNDDDANNQQQQHQQDKKKISCQCQPQAYAVECNFGSHYGIIRSKREIILCCGAIGTPALLLASGIGMEDDLKEAGITPWYEHVKCNNHCCGDNSHANHHNLYRVLRVGHQLRDHILLPRVFLSPYQQQSVQSVNSIQGWWMTNVPMTNNTSSCNNVVDAKMQLQLADGSQMDYMIPHFAAAALRRRWALPIVDIELSFTWIRWIFRSVRAFLRAFFGIPIFSRWVKSHTTSLNLCLLNPKSVGRVTVKSNSRLKPYTRLSECNILIDPNYLSDSSDVESLWRGWTFSGRVRQRQLLNKWCIEILPGCILTIGVAIYSLVGSTIYWIKVLLGGKMHDDKKKVQNNCDESVPKWFLQYASEFSNPYYHWCGTCAMGEEDGKAGSKRNAGGGGSSVVDDHLCVRGLSNLRVCDASVFPNSVSTPMALTCAALGHAASSTLLTFDKARETTFPTQETGTT